RTIARGPAPGADDTATIVSSGWGAAVAAVSVMGQPRAQRNSGNQASPARVMSPPTHRLNRPRSDNSPSPNTAFRNRYRAYPATGGSISPSTAVNTIRRAVSSRLPGTIADSRAGSADTAAGGGRSGSPSSG